MAAAASSEGNLERAAAQLRAFLNAHGDVLLTEAGEPLARLEAADSGYAVHTEAGRLVCHFWTPEANLVRRVIATAESAGKLRLQCLRLGQARPSWLTLETARAAPGPSGGGREARRRRLEFRQAVAAAARRDWPGWQAVAAGREGRDPAASPVQCLLLRRGRALLAVAALAAEDAPAHGLLTHALSWAEEVRRRWPESYLHAVRLIVPESAAAAVLEVRPWLEASVPVEVYGMDRSSGHLDPLAGSPGNATAALRRAPSPGAEPGPGAAALLREIREFCPQATLEYSLADARWSVRLYGLEIASECRPGEGGAAGFVFGCGRERSPIPEDPRERELFHRFLRAAGAQRVAHGDRRDPWFALQPERWLEHLLRHDLAALDTLLDPRFRYTQIPAWSQADRDILDLLAVTRHGRLVVLELKTAEDADFPLQALAYWARVRRHWLDGDFRRMGYFPGVELGGEPPLLWLIAPALRWHPDTHRILAWVSRAVPWTLIGINEDWRRGLQVLERRTRD